RLDRRCGRVRAVATGRRADRRPDRADPERDLEGPGAGPAPAVLPRSRPGRILRLANGLLEHADPPGRRCVMSKKASATAVDSITVKYDLFDLPTAQHKAGLAGLVLQIRHMGKEERSLPAEAIPEIVEFTTTGATVRFTPRSTQALFDELYDASVEEIAVKT